MTRSPRYTQAAVAGLLATLLAPPLLGALAQAAEAPTLWGYGVKPCSDFLAVAPAEQVPAAIGGEEYLRYREWLAGLVTGINVATASDVLRGAELDAALGRIRTLCKSHPRDDFFNAAMTLIRSLRADKSPAARKPK